MCVGCNIVTGKLLLFDFRNKAASILFFAYSRSGILGAFSSINFSSGYIPKELTEPI